MMKEFLIAMDPGKKQDPAAIQVWRLTPELQPAMDQLERGTQILYYDDLVLQYRIQDKRYTELGDFIFDLMNREVLANRCLLVFDCTGVGEAVKDILFERGVVDMIPLLYTGRGKVEEIWVDQTDERFKKAKSQSLPFQTLKEIHVPKPDLVSAAIAELEAHRIRLAPGVPYLDDFKRQLMEFRGKMNDKGYTSYNNSSDKIHDDWVNAFMMRSWTRRYYRETIRKKERSWGNSSHEIANVLGGTFKC